MNLMEAILAMRLAQRVSMEMNFLLVLTIVAESEMALVQSMRHALEIESGLAMVAGKFMSSVLQKKIIHSFSFVYLAHISNAKESCVNLKFNVGNNSCNRSAGCNACQQQQGMFNVPHMV